ncbi:MAG: phage tail tape measure protein, partial [Desulfobacteraceae bacterium]|nr:phage tail tape measure protein [Desulfobacteraceae bacterium]
MASNVIEIRIDVDSDTGSASVRRFSGDTEREMRRAGKSVSSVNEKMLSVGKSIAALGAAYVSFDSIKTGIQIGSELEHQLAAVEGVMRATEQEAWLLGEAVLAVGYDETEHDSRKAAEALKYMGMAGWSAEKSVASLGTVLDISTAGNLDLSSASDIVTDSMTSMGLGVQDLDRFANVLIGTITQSNTDISMMGESLKYAAPIAKNLGLSLEETAAYIGTLANAGIKASDSGTDLRQALLRNQKAIKALSEETINYTAVAERLNLKEGKLIDVIRAAKEAQWDANKVTEEFGMIASKSVLVLMENIDAYDQLHGNLQNVDGAAEKLAGRMRDTVAGSFKSLTSVIQTLAIETFNKYKDTLKETLVSSADFLRNHREHILLMTDAAVGFGKVALVGGVFYAAVAGIPALIGAAKTAMIAYNMSLLTAHASSALLAGGLTSVKAAGGLLTAAVAGWQIGSMLYDNFEEARLVGLAFVDSVMTAFINFEAGILIIFEGIKAGFLEMIKLVSNMVRPALASIKALAVASDFYAGTNYASSIEKAQIALNNFRTSKSDFKDATAELMAERDAEITQHHAIIEAIRKENEEFGRKKDGLKTLEQTEKDYTSAVEKENAKIIEIKEKTTDDIKVIQKNITKDQTAELKKRQKEHEKAEQAMLRIQQSFRDDYLKTILEPEEFFIHKLDERAQELRDARVDELQIIAWYNTKYIEYANKKAEEEKRIEEKARAERLKALEEKNKYNTPGWVAAGKAVGETDSFMGMAAAAERAKKVEEQITADHYNEIDKRRQATDNFFNKVLSGGVTTWDDLTKEAGTLFSAFADDVDVKWNETTGEIEITGIDAFSNIFSSVWDIATKLFDGLSKGFGSLWENVKGGASSVLGKVGEWAGGLFSGDGIMGGIGEWAGNLFSGDGVLGGIGEWAGNLFSGDGVLGGIGEWAGNLFSGGSMSMGSDAASLAAAQANPGMGGIGGIADNFGQVAGMASAAYGGYQALFGDNVANRGSALMSAAGMINPYGGVINAGVGYVTEALGMNETMSETTSGIAGGAAAGATIGSVLPGIGNIVGGIVGAVVGGISSLIGHKSDPAITMKDIGVARGRDSGMTNFMNESGELEVGYYGANPDYADIYAASEQGFSDIVKSYNNQLRDVRKGLDDETLQMFNDALTSKEFSVEWFRENYGYDVKIQDIGDHLGSMMEEWADHLWGLLNETLYEVEIEKLFQQGIGSRLTAESISALKSTEGMTDSEGNALSGSQTAEVMLQRFQEIQNVWDSVTSEINSMGGQIGDAVEPISEYDAAMAQIHARFDSYGQVLEKVGFNAEALAEIEAERAVVEEKLNRKFAEARKAFSDQFSEEYGNIDIGMGYQAAFEQLDTGVVNLEKGLSDLGLSAAEAAAEAGELGNIIAGDLMQKFAEARENLLSGFSDKYDNINVDIGYQAAFEQFDTDIADLEKNLLKFGLSAEEAAAQAGELGNTIAGDLIQKFAEARENLLAGFSDKYKLDIGTKYQTTFDQLNADITELAQGLEKFGLSAAEAATQAKMLGDAAERDLVQKFAQARQEILSQAQSIAGMMPEMSALDASISAANSQFQTLRQELTNQGAGHRELAELESYRIARVQNLRAEAHQTEINGMMQIRNTAIQAFQEVAASIQKNMASVQEQINQANFIAGGGTNSEYLLQQIEGLLAPGSSTGMIEQASGLLSEWYSAAASEAQTASVSSAGSYQSSGSSAPVGGDNTQADQDNFARSWQALYGTLGLSTDEYYQKEKESILASVANFEQAGHNRVDIEAWKINAMTQLESDRQDALQAGMQAGAELHTTISTERTDAERFLTESLGIANAKYYDAQRAEIKKTADYLKTTVSPEYLSDVETWKGNALSGLESERNDAMGLETSIDDAGNTFSDSISSAASEWTEQVSKTVREFDDLTDSIQGTIDDLRYGNMSIYNAAERQEKSAADYEAMSSKVFSGTATADDIKEFQDISKQYLELSYDRYNSDENYHTIFREVEASLTSLKDVNILVEETRKPESSGESSETVTTLPDTFQYSAFSIPQESMQTYTPAKFSYSPYIPAEITEAATAPEMTSGGYSPGGSAPASADLSGINDQFAALQEMINHRLADVKSGEWILHIDWAGLAEDSQSVINMMSDIVANQGEDSEIYIRFMSELGTNFEGDTDAWKDIMTYASQFGWEHEGMLTLTSSLDFGKFKGDVSKAQGLISWVAGEAG